MGYGTTFGGYSTYVYELERQRQTNYEGWLLMTSTCIYCQEHISEHFGETRKCPFAPSNFKGVIG